MEAKINSIELRPTQDGDFGQKSNSPSLGDTIKVGSRKSKLALIQTNIVINQLEKFYENNPDRLKQANKVEANVCRPKYEIIEMTTEGDRILDKPLPDIGTKSLFTKDLEVALLEGKLDFIVHSLKDLPTTLPEGCAIGAILKRDNPNDCIVLKKSLIPIVEPLDLLMGRCKQVEVKGLQIGTSSLRRIAMLKRNHSSSECFDIRGNLNTRLAKLDREDGNYAAIILARAGLDRMGWSDRCSSLLSPEQDPDLADWCYAVGQGAIAVECRSDDKRILDLLAAINDLKTTYEAVLERSLLRKLEGGCSIPLGVRTTWIDDRTIKLRSVILSIDGKTMHEAEDVLTIEAGGRTKIAKFEPLHESITTGIVLSDIIMSGPHLRHNIAKCSKLGIYVANKLIEKGCLELMRQKK